MGMAEVKRVEFADDAILPMPSGSGGVYSARQKPEIVRAPILTRRETGGSDIVNLTRRETGGSDVVNDSVEEGDYKKKQVFSGWYLLWLTYQSTGVIYGDIGTSPLYVYSSTFTSDPSRDDLIGALSLIIWTLILMVSVKYVLIVLRADDEGEGGTFALYSLLSRYSNIVRRDPREQMTVKMERVEASELRSAGRRARSFIERSRIAKYLLRTIGVFGVSLVMSDGVLTPAQSVLGAIQGLEVVKPDISNGTIVGVSCAILVLLFLIQPLGTTKIASSFAPIVIIWLLFNLIFGIYNLVVYDASVLKAFSPYFAGAYLVRNKTDGWKSLGGILLAFTGCEALFADLGAFTRQAVQLSWLCFAFPCLLLGYIGQAAYIMDDRSAWSNPFFNTVPPGMLYPSLVIAILAAIVASQAMITAVFQLLSQIMKLSYFPQIKLIHTSKIFHGQIYIPFANWLLMIGTVIVTGVYNNTTKLGHAYGVCVILVTFITTSMVALVALIIWRIPLPIVIFFYLVFGALDCLYLSSALTKVPDGAWFTLVLAVVLSSIFILWRFGKEQQWIAEASDRFPPSHILVSDHSASSDADRALRLTPAFGGAPVSTIDGIGIFFDKAGAASTTPTVFIHFLQKFHAANEVIVFFHLHPVPTPTVSPEERYSVTRCLTGWKGDQMPLTSNCYRVTIRHGYTDEVVTDDLALLIFDQLRNFIIREGVPSVATVPKRTQISLAEESDSGSATTITAEKGRHPNREQMEVSKRLAELQTAFHEQVVFIVGKEQMRIREGTGILRRLALSAFLWLRENSRSKVQALNIEADRLVEVGFVKEV